MSMRGQSPLMCNNGKQKHHLINSILLKSMYIDTQNLRTWDLIDHEPNFHMHNVLLTVASVSDLPTSFSIKSPEPETPLGIYLMSRWQFLLFKKKKTSSLQKKKLQVLSFLLNLTVTY